MPDIVPSIEFPGIEDISGFEFVYGRGIEPHVCIIECLPQDELLARAGTLTIVYGQTVLEFPDMLIADQWLKQVDCTTSTVKDTKPPAKMYVKLLDHRHRWRGGRIVGVYNIRMADGSVYAPSRKEPAELAALCLQAMGEFGFDVSAMPQGVYPPAMWNNANPADCLDYLCRYVGCEITGGERGKVVIVPAGVGAALPGGGDPINNPHLLRNQDGPSRIEIIGGETIWQAKLKLAGHVLQNDVAEPLSFQGGAATNWPRQSPFSLPGLTTDETRHDAFESEFRQFPVTSLADGSNNLPLAPFAITKPWQYLLKDWRLDTFTDLTLVPRNYPARVEGKFFPYGDDADSYTSITPYTGRFLIRKDGNIVEFPYPIWKTDTGGNVEVPELYLLTTFALQTVDGDGRAVFTAARNTGGNQGVKTLQRPELFYAVAVAYQGDGITTNGASSTLPATSNEANRYLDIFAQALQTIDQVDLEWLDILDIKLDGRTAQVRVKGSVIGGFTTRASQGFEFDIYGPTLHEKRGERYVKQQLEGAYP